MRVKIKIFSEMIMLKAHQLIQYQRLVNRANHGDLIARLELTYMAMQYLKKKEVPENIAFGMSVLEDLSKCRDEVFQIVLAKIMYEFTRTILRDNPTLAVKLFILASKLGNFEAKHNLAICFFHGDGTERRLDKVVDLLKECYHAGDQTVLAEMYTIAVQLLFGYNSRAPSDLRRAIEISTAVELLKFAARAGHAGALKDFAILGWWFYRGIAPCSRNIEQGIAIIKMAAKLGDKWAVDKLETVGAELGAAGAEMVQTKPELGFEVLIIASELGNLKAKHNLAVCFLEGIGTEKQPRNAVNLFKECCQLERKSLKHINTIAVRFLSGSEGCQKDVAYSMELFAYAAQDNEDARTSLYVLANHFLSPEKLEPDYGIAQDVPAGRRILHYLAELKQFKGILGTLNSHLPRASIPAIICEYLPEIQPVFFQYKNVPDGANKNSSSVGLVKLHL
jgi:TPR repeat protein